MTDKIGDILVRLDFYQEADVLDFEKTGKAVLVVEDGVASLPLPAGEKGEPGPKGDPGGKMIPDLILQEFTDGEALNKLQERSSGWRASNRHTDGYFAINKNTGSGFFYTRGGWIIYRDIFGSNSEIVAGEFDLPVTFRNTEEPSAPVSGVVMFAQGGSLKVKKADGSVVTLA